MPTFKVYRSQYPSVKLLFSVAASGANSAFRNVSESASVRLTFAENILACIQENDLHGGTFTFIIYFISNLFKCKYFI